MYDEFLWLSLLDPRFGRNSDHWKSKDELNHAEENLVLEVQKLAVDVVEKRNNIIKDNSDRSESSKESADKEDDEFTFNIDAPQKSKTKRNSEKLLTSEQKLTKEEKEKCRSLVKHEVHAFLIETQTSNNMDPLMWWKAKHFNYPNVARVAQKWLSVLATSTPSERVFSICGLVDTTKRSNLLGESIEKQVFLHNNIDEVELE